VVALAFTPTIMWVIGKLEVKVSFNCLRFCLEDISAEAIALLVFHNNHFGTLLLDHHQW
jgi:hypothetical protein